MDRRTVSGIVLVLVLPAVWCALAWSAEPQAIKWHSSLIAAHEVSVRENKPMLVVFGADWCGYCKKLEQTTLAHPQMAAYVNSAFVPVHLDLDHDKRTAEVLEVKSIPCSVVLSPDADLLGRVVGYTQAQQYYETLVESRRLQAQIEQTVYLQKP